MPKRIEQVNEFLRREIAWAIERYVELPDALATVTVVTAAPDLRTANVSISILPSGKAGSGMQAIRRQRNLIYTALKKRVSWRAIPALTFHFDDTHKQAADIQTAIADALR